jgi:hypothetical protein
VTARHLLGRFTTEAGSTGGHRVLPNMISESESYDLPPLHGRAGEVARLERMVLEAFEERSARVALVVGPAGVGKSRLRIEIERRLAERREAEWLIARANPLGGGVPLGVLQNASREWFEAAQSCAAGARRRSRRRRWSSARQVPPVVIAPMICTGQRSSPRVRRACGATRSGPGRDPVVRALGPIHDFRSAMILISRCRRWSAPRADRAAARAEHSARGDRRDAVRAGQTHSSQGSRGMRRSRQARRARPRRSGRIQARSINCCDQHAEVGPSVIGREFDRAAPRSTLVIER